MHVLSGGRLRMKKSIYLPEADRSDTLELPVSSILLRHRGANVLFDTGCHPSVVEDAQARWGAMAKAIVPIMGFGDHVIAGLKLIGLSPDDIDIVINSHLHPDHCGCNAFFRRATVMVHARELEAAKAGNAAAAGYLSAEWDHPMPLDPFAGERDVFGDARLVLVPLPGHTPGSTGALVGLDRSGSFLLASDAVSLRASLDRDIVPRNTWNQDLFLASLAEIRRIEKAGATVICGHDAAQWEALRKGGHAYD
jgi:N-acyl homoserine lactone hydrolase